jgi:hypothetical protein
MDIKIKYDGKTITVSVSKKECKNYTCFVPHKFEHYGRTIDGESNNYTDKFYSCANRNYHGCPDMPKSKKEVI